MGKNLLVLVLLVLTTTVVGYSKNNIQLRTSRPVFLKYTGIKHLQADKPGVIRSEAVLLDSKPFKELDKNIGQRKTTGNNKISLSFFNEKSYTSIIEEVEEVYYGEEATIAYRGVMEGYEQSSVTFVRTGEIISGSIQFGKQAYKIENIDGEIHRINEMDYSQMPSDPPSLIPDYQLEKSTSADEPQSKGDSGNIIDVMVIYTPKARSTQGGTTAIENLIALAVTESNTGYAQSGVTQRMRLVNTYEVDYTEGSNWSTILSHLRGTTDGNMDEIHDLRSIYGADHVVLIIDEGTYCGLAYMMTSVSSSFSNWAFAVVDRTCATGYYSFAHELGHNMGCDHDENNDDYKGGAYIYSSGYQSLDASPRARSIMAYYDGCSCSRVNYWSNPDIIVNGKPFGVHHDSLHSADNRLSLNNTLSTTQNFKQSINSTIVVEESNEVTSGETINLGNVGVGGSSDKIFKITNLSGSSISVSGISLGNTTDFSVTSNPSSTIPAGGNSKFTVQFNPASSGSKTSTININNSILSFNLSGNGVVNNPPNTPSTPSPSDLATNVSISSNLSWSGGDSDGDPVTYTVKFGTSNPPPTIGTISNVTSYNLSTLESDTHYYWKIIASDGTNSTDGPVWEFTTETVITPPYIKTVTAGSITSEAARCYGQIENENGNTITEVGICYNTTGSPDIDDNVKAATSVTTNFSSNLTGLTPYTRYYYRAYALYDGTEYGSTKNFKTDAARPILGATSLDTITETTAKVNSTITEIYDAEIQYSGIVYATASGFDYETEGIVLIDTVNWTTTGPFSIDLSNLSSGIQYFYRVFIENSVGRTYSDELQFTTLSSAPTIDLDEDNSTSSGNSFRTVFNEGDAYVSICDSDIKITDNDNSGIEELLVVFANPQNKSVEAIQSKITHDSITIISNNSDTIQLINKGGATYGNFEEVLKGICYINNSENPNTTEREVRVKAKDETEFGPVSISQIEIVSINDAPINTEQPTIGGEFEINGTLIGKPGTWNDYLDGGATTITYQITWQKADIENPANEDILDIKTGTDTTYTVVEADFNKWFRIKVTATDNGTGIPTTASTDAYSIWYEVGKEEQSITFDAIPEVTFGCNPFEIYASASSKLEVSFTSENETIASINGKTVTVHKGGSVKIWANQAGNNDFYPASAVSQTLIINPAHQVISFDEIETKIYGNQDFNLSASSTSGLNVEFFILDEEIATINGQTVSIQNSGSTLIGAFHPGNESYLASDTAYQTLTISKATQQISNFININTKTYGDTDFQLSAEATSGLAVTFDSENPEILSINGTQAKINGAGNVKVYAFAQESRNYLGSDSIDQIIAINKANQTISFTPIATTPYSEGSIVFDATSTSGLDIQFRSLDTSIVKIENQIGTIVGIGNVTIEAEQMGNENYEAAAPTQQIVEIVKGNQTIEFTQIDQKHYGDNPFGLQALASSGLPLTYESSNTDVCTIDGNILTILKVGSSNITATQKGNAYYEPGISSQVLSIKKGIQKVISFNTPETKKYGENPFEVTAELNSGHQASYLSSNELVLGLDQNSATIKCVGQVELSAYNLGDDNWEASDTLTKIITIEKGEQTLIFEDILNKKYNDPPFKIFASSSAGLPITFTCKDSNIVTLSNDSVYIVGTGNAYVFAEQEGNELWNAAERLRQSVYVKRATQNITFNLNDTLIFTNDEIELSVQSNSGLEISTFESSNHTVADISGNHLLLKNQGETTLKALQNGSDFYYAAETSKTITVVFPTYMTHENEMVMKLYPNPTSGIVKYQFTNNYKAGNLEVYNSLGEQMLNKNTLPEGIIDLSGLPTGIYYFIYRNNQQVMQQSIIKR